MCMNKNYCKEILIAIIAMVSANGCSSPPETETATLAVKDARVWTGNAEQPWAEAVAARDDKIIAVGTNAEIDTLIGDDTDVIAVPDSMLVPGFIDTHVHFIDGGSSLASVQLRDAATPDEFTGRIAEFASGIEPGEWIRHGTWDHENWGGELPQRDWIDAVTPDNPVWIHRLDGHMALANSLALSLAGVDADTPDVEGGSIVRDKAGRPTGILKDNAMMLVGPTVPDSSEAQLDREAAAAMQHVTANGVTSVHDMAAGK